VSNYCIISNETINLPISIPRTMLAKCPKCGAIRKLRKTRDGEFVYPTHDMLDGDPRPRPCWEQAGETWVMKGE
jgi:hypothetical protein